MPRKILAANQIFNEDGEASIDPDTPTSAPATAKSSTFAVPEPSQVSVIIEETSVLLSLTPPVSPARRRRATVVTRSPETKKRTSDDLFQGSPSKRGLLYGPISPRDELERELERCKSLISSRELCVLKFIVSGCSYSSHSAFCSSTSQCVHCSTFAGA